ncbi:MAG: SDR family oxidoreductase [Chloroflexota bacterium]|nr:SDR family oxidoreductase [Chloroflexota bacterium]
MAKDALAGKVAVVTGGGTGIGAGICESLAGAGAKVVVSPHKNVAGAERTAAALRQSGASAIVQACDVREYDQVQALFDLTLREFQRVDILVNNAGITEPHPLLEMTVDEWDKTLDINLRGMFLCTQRAAREMIKAGAGGRVVNLSSVHGYGAVPNHAHYEASKGGINMFTKASAIELAPHNIQVNAIAPGVIEVERYADMPNYDRQEWAQRIPAGRVGFADDIGPLAAFLCSEGASYITGQIIWVDGGMTTRLGGLR